MKSYKVIAAATCGLGLMRAASALVPEYTILDLNTLGGTNSEAYGLNNASQVVGRSYITGTTWRGFVTSPNHAINPATDALTLLTGGTQNRGFGINATGVIAGWSASSAGSFGVRYSPGAATLGTLGGGYSYGQAINNLGQVVGSAGLPKSQGNFPTHAVLYNGTTAIDLGHLADGDDSFAYSINSSGAIVGYSGDPNGAYANAFLWTPSSPNAGTGTISAVPSLGGTYNYAYGINNAGQIVGSSNVADDSQSHAYVSSSGTITDLGTLGGTSAEAEAINNLAMIVGDSRTAAAVTHAFFDSNGVMVDLNTLIPANSNWTLQKANAINDLGQIAGIGINPAGATHAYLLTPLPTWAVDSSGTWSDSSKWLGSVPSGAGAEVRFTGAIAAPRTITLDSPRTIGHLVFDNSNRYTITGPGNLTISGATATTGIEVRSGGHSILTPVKFASAATISLAASSSLVLGGPVTGAVSAVSLQTNSTLDLTNNNLVIDYAAGSASPIGSITTSIMGGYHGGQWNGQGIDSSTAASVFSDPSKPHKTALGVADASALGITNFSGQAVDSTSVLIRYTLRGDANLDGVVNALDFNLLATNFGTGGKRWDQGDFNYDGNVNTSDFTTMAANFGATMPAAGISTGALVPEPSTLAWLSLVTILTHRRRR
jgi:probable HAF family extracellular repeat protein